MHECMYFKLCTHGNTNSHTKLHAYRSILDIRVPSLFMIHDIRVEKETGHAHRLCTDVCAISCENCEKAEMVYRRSAVRAHSNTPAILATDEHRRGAVAVAGA
jgi:hypothetical protein